MLQPTDAYNEEPPLLVPASQAVPSEARGTEARGLWRWVSLREVVFVFMACSVGAALFQARDRLRLAPTWQEPLDTNLYSNGEFPFGDEKLPPPLVTDVDGDELNDMLLLTYDQRLRLLSTPDARNPFKPQTHKQITTEKATLNLLELVKQPHIRVIAMTTGFLQAYQSMVQVRHQVVVLLTSDWTVFCLDHTLTLLWKAQPLAAIESTVIREATILVTSVSIRKGDLGAVIVGGREFTVHASQDSFKRTRRGEKVEEDKLLDSLDHYNTFALEGGTGDLRWKHTQGDYEIDPAYPPDVSSFKHLKLMLHRYVAHEGEVSWHQYSSAIRQAMPHTWHYTSDTRFQLAHFKKDRKKSEQPRITEHVSQVSDLAVDHMAGMVFGGFRPHSAEDHVTNPNVLLVHSIKGIDVLHVYLGRPLCSLRLSPSHSAHADINGDGTIDHVHAIVNPGDAGFSEQLEDIGDCYGRAVPMQLNARPLFQHSICKASHWTEVFVSTDRWLPGLNIIGRKKVRHAITEPLPPVLIKSPYHSAPLRLHLGGIGISRLLSSLSSSPPPSSPPPSSLPATPPPPISPMYDSIFVLSSGRVTSIGPLGEFNWQVDTNADWDSASEVIYDQTHPSWEKDFSHVSFVHGGFTPAALPISLQAFGQKEHVLVSGWTSVVVLDARDGSVVAAVPLGCHPVAPPSIVDFTNDGWNDIIVTCANQYTGFSLSRHSGFWQSTMLGLYVGLVVVVVAVYARQRSGLLTVAKTAQD